MSLLHNCISSSNFDHDWIYILHKFGTILKFGIDTLEHLQKKMFFVINLMSYLRSQYLPTAITIQLSNGSCKIRYIMLNSFAVNEFLYILYVNHTPCLHFPRTSIKLSYLYGVCPSPDIYSYHLNVFPGIPRISSFKLI